MTIALIFIMLMAIHWFADFVCQTHEDAMGKSTSVKRLFSHVADYSVMYTLIMFAFCYGLGGVAIMHKAAIFGAITFVAHFITDYFTSKLNAKLWKSGNVHNFFVSVGFDQLLHTIQLILTYVLIFL